MGIGSTWRAEFMPIQRAPQMDMRCVAAARRMRRIDAVLSSVSSLHRSVLRRVYGERNRLEVFGPAGNLVPLVAHHWHLRSRSRRTYAAWLTREASKATRGTGDARLLRELSAAADVLLAAAGEEYAARRQ